MSKTINIGKSAGGKAVTLDIGRLIVSRVLVTATSGGGKSWLLRKILEGVSKTTQTIVIDPEGEFASLRELRDMLLVGPDGEIPADPRSAGLLVRRLMELNVSAVIDIYELTPTMRRDFVARFCQAMVDLPKALWRPCVVAIDEAHEFAPEEGNVASSEAVALLQSKGRKRGYCPLLATQRLSKLSKDVAAEAKNRFVGQMILDTDQKRAADTLGFPKARWTELRDLSPPGHEGEFFAVGPALNDRGVIKFRAGPVETSHPKAGEGRSIEPPEPSKKIVGVLTELKDLSEKAGAEIRDLAAARARIVELERAARTPAASPSAAITAAATAELRKTNRQQAAAIVALRKGLADAMKVIDELQKAGVVDRETVQKAVTAATDQIVRAAESRYVKVKKQAEALVAQMKKLFDGIPDFSTSSSPAAARSDPGTAALTSMQEDDGPVSIPATVASEGLSVPQQAILDTVLMLEKRGITAGRDTVARWLAIHPKGGSYGTNLGFLRGEGYLNGFILTERGREAAKAIPTGLKAALAALPDDPKRTIVQTLVNAGRPMTRDGLAAALGIHPKGGSYGTNLGWLRTMRIITERGPIAPTEGLMK